MLTSCNMFFVIIVIEDPITPMPAADGKNLRLYTLPVGQGSAHIIQCPDGTVAIFDLGTCSSQVANPVHWNADSISAFLQGHWDKIKNVVISHQHKDHTSLLKDAISNKAGTYLENIYISCTNNKNRLSQTMKDWLDTITPDGYAKLRMFSNGDPCGTDTMLCTSAPDIDLCPKTSHPKFITEVIWANEQCNPFKNTKNRESLVLKIEHLNEMGQVGPVSILLPGDIEGTDNLEYHRKDRLKSTAYVFSHHGSIQGNTDSFLKAISPSVVFASGKQGPPTINMCSDSQYYTVWVIQY